MIGELGQEYSGTLDLCTKIRLYETLLEYLKEDEQNELPSVDFIVALSRFHLKRNNRELAQAIAKSKKSLLDLESATEIAQSDAAMQEQVGVLIEKRIEDTRAEKRNAKQLNVEEQTAKLVDENNYLMSKLSDFLETQYPPQTGAGHKVETSLQQLLEDLMNLAVQSTDSNKYLDSSLYWPPYVELLLRANIAIPHENDSKFISLNNFGHLNARN